MEETHDPHDDSAPIRSGGVDIKAGTITVKGDVVGRDKILNIDIRLFPVVILLAIIIAVLAYLLLRPTIPTAMTGEFNVAVAEFTVLGQNGSPTASGDGLKLADFLFNRLTIELGELALDIPYELWPPTYTGSIEGNTQEERAQAAEALAERIGSHVLIYGVITDAGDQSQFAPEFYVDYKGFEESEEITGQHELGSALRVILPFDNSQFQGLDNPALVSRTKALSLLTIGLTYYSNDNFETALDYFAQAEAIEGWLNSAGKEVIYLLLGNANVRLASKEKSPKHLAAALDNYSTALNIKPTYSRALVGRASALYLMALGDPAVPSFDDVDLGLLDESTLGFEEALRLGGTPKSANIETKVHFGLGQIYFVRAQIFADDWLTRATAEFEQVVQEYENGNTGVKSLAGHAYARLGLITWLQGDTSAAVDSYTRATELASPYYQAYYLSRLGEVHIAACQIDLAIEAYIEAIRIAELFGDGESAERYSQRLKELESQEWIC